MMMVGYMNMNEQLTFKETLSINIGQIGNFAAHLKAVPLYI